MNIGYIIAFILGDWFGILIMMALYLISRDRRHRDDKEAANNDI